MRLILAILILTLVSSSCSKEGKELSKGDVTVEPTFPSGNENYLTNSSDYIYNQEELRSYHLIIPEENLSFLDRDPAAEQYVEAKLILEGDTISPVGVRYKGSIGAFVGCLSGFNVLEPSGRKTCTKLSIKVKINWEGREDRFYKLKKLQFHSMNI